MQLCEDQQPQSWLNCQLQVIDRKWEWEVVVQGEQANTSATTPLRIKDTSVFWNATAPLRMEDTCIFWSNERAESTDLLDLCWASLSDMIGLNVVTLLKVVNKLILQGSEKSCFLLYTVLHPWYTRRFGAFWSWLSLCFCCFLFQHCLSSLLQRIFERETWVYSVAGEDGSPAFDISMSCRMQFFCLTQYCTNTTKKTLSIWFK